MRYANSSQDPDATARTINVAVSDGSSSSGTAVSTISITPVNDAPVLVAGSAGGPGAEFLVNTNTTDQQIEPSVAALSGGGFIAVWESHHPNVGPPDTDVPEIKAQLFDSAGNPSGAEFQINTNDSNPQATPVVAALAGGGFAVAWHSLDGATGDINSNGIGVRIYNAAGTPVTAEFLANTNDADFQTEPAITALAGGGFVVSWSTGTPPVSGRSATLPHRSSPQPVPRSEPRSWSIPTRAGRSSPPALRRSTTAASSLPGNPMILRAMPPCGASPRSVTTQAARR